jgi:hypothetical protein
MSLRLHSISVLFGLTCWTVLVLAAVRGGSGAQGADGALRAAGAGRRPWSAEARPREHEVLTKLLGNLCSVPSRVGLLTGLLGYIGFVLRDAWPTYEL